MQTNSRPAPLFTAYRWGARCALAAVVGFSPLVHAQNSPAPETSATNSDGTELLSADALDELLGPIALYPDALVALILPASTVPGDVTLAARYLANGGDGNAVDDQSWDPSVKSLTRYPDVVKWMDDNLEWTTSVGQAFIAQPADVMNSIQQLRGEATAAGNLEDTPQQKVVKEVVQEKTYIRIVPAEPEVIYVPQYDPEVVYVERQPDYVGPIIGFGVGFAVGSWLNYDCDWGRRDVYCGDYNRDWDRGRDWNRGNNNNNNWVNNNTVNNVNNVNVVNINNATARPWRASASSRRQLEQHRTSYNRRVQQANAEVRTARQQSGKNGAAARPHKVKSIPQPTRMASNPNRGKNANGNNGNNDRKNGNGGNGNGNGANAAQKPKNPGPNANGNQNGNGNGNGGNGNGNKGKGNGNGQKHNGVKTPSAAPQVPGQLNKPKNPNSDNNKPGKGNNSGNKANNADNKPNNNKPKNQGNSDSAPKRQPQDRPKNDGPSKKQSSNNEFVKRPSAAPTEVSRPKPKNNNNGNNNDRPKAQNRPQAESPQPKAKQNNDRPKQQAQPRPQGNPQASKPKNNPGSGNGNGNGGGGDKKKDKKKGDKKDN